MTFACRVRVVFEAGFSINLSENPLKINISLVDNSIRILELDEGKRRDEVIHSGDPYTLVLTTGGFESEKEAFEYGRLIKKALLVRGIQTRLGIDAGKETSEVIIGTFHTGKMLADVHGLLVYQESNDPIGFTSAWGSYTQEVSSEKFLEGFSTTVDLVSNLSDKQSLAIELYNLAHFEISLNARFLTLVTCVECLVEEAKRSDDVIKHVDDLIEFTREKFNADNLDNTLNQKFISWLNNLKDESISQTCKALVRKLLDEKSAKKFAEHYETRSQLVHTGRVPPNVNLRIAIPELDDLVSRLIYASLTSSNSVD